MGLIDEDQLKSPVSKNRMAPDESASREVLLEYITTAKKQQIVSDLGDCFETSNVDDVTNPSDKVVVGSGKKVLIYDKIK